ncbi:putative glycolipid-binding domain-containing protein [Arthrobacter zhangbolii]|uniref:Glycolipid-binding domain-containing protein n=1 Tax=Arthrobacter zhangbolii TaxID=2886936 RepID=A0A9X1M827_9MICC|nr:MULTISPECIES: putative glycolipid-binding domain-containing protein [Arthrobacter]MCC3272600.1 putative glycolipid-binding domain-containing protein [Arthrobacter zhangbolii]MDN3903663.1 putative glycolipid-binding domain-containing protein [Arthrobacter sp. YD2]UON91552.1 putative glycolipid-binding domain-containing protein [Arthrobacter zhangbolii]
MTSTALARTIRWQGQDDPDRTDTAVLSFRDRELAAAGTSVSAEYTASWTLSTIPGWVTSQLSVSVTGDGWSRTLRLERSIEGRWSAETTQNGTVDLPAPGISDPRSLDEAQDCDVALCPATNTMPILRLDLLNESAPPDETQLTMAWVEMPSLRVVPSRQVYSQVRAYSPEAGHAVVLYSSESHGFTAELKVDSDGTVIDYPGMATRLP